MVKRDCRYYLWYGRHFCKYVWKEKPAAEPTKLELGCPEDCVNYQYASWKAKSDNDSWKDTEK